MAQLSGCIACAWGANPLDVGGRIATVAYFYRVVTMLSAQSVWQGLSRQCALSFCSGHLNAAVVGHINSGVVTPSATCKAW